MSLDLEAIKRKLPEAGSECDCDYGNTPCDICKALIDAGCDVPALISEVERLRTLEPGWELLRWLACPKAKGEPVVGIYQRILDVVGDAMTKQKALEGTP